VALPLALAFGIQSGLGASAGLYGAMILGLLAAIFGGTNTQISGPTGPMTVISATVVSIAISRYGNIDNAWGIIVLTFLLADAFQLVFGLLKIGKYIPYPVLSGFMSGITGRTGRHINHRWNRYHRHQRPEKYIQGIQIRCNHFSHRPGTNCICRSLTGSCIGMVIAFLIFMRKASDIMERNTSLTRVDKYDREVAWEDEKNLSLNKEHVYIKRFDGPVFFDMTAKMMEWVNKIHADAEVIIFRMKKVPFIDQSGLHALEEVIKEMQKMGIVVVLSMTQPQPLSLLRKTRFIPDILPEKSHP